MLNRRTFLGALATLTAVAGSGIGTLLMRPMVDVKEIDPGILAPLEGRAVTLRASDGRALPSTVTSVRTVRTRSVPGAPATVQISMLVKARDPESAGGLYQVESDDLVLDTLHFMPVGRSGNDRRLEAVITRIV